MEIDVESLPAEQLERLAGLIAERMSRTPSAATKKRSERRVQYLIQEELDRLFRAIEGAGNPRDLAIFEVAYHRGLRASEVGGLKMGHLRLESRRLYVERLKHGRSGEYPLTDREIRALRGYLRVRGRHGGALFPSRQGNPISRIRLHELMQQYAQRAELPAEKRHFHCLRHSCATQLVERDVDLLLIQDHLGHADVRSTEIYARVSDKKRREVGERLAREW